jgi:signal transduction histidine kinase
MNDNIGENGKVTILIVDDNENNMKVLCCAIADFGWKILSASDGESAIAQAEEAQPDIILLDVMMPGMDGFETCHQLKTKSTTCKIPVIFMTALTDIFDKIKGLSIGGVDYVTKPFHIEEILARIDIHLKLQSLTKQLEQQKQDLEIRINERTAELTQALAELKQSQLQIIQSEKMSTLGQLIASVAHDINNPTSFITCNLSLISEYTSLLSEHLKLYQKNYPHPNLEIIENEKKIFLNELFTDIPEVIDSMKNGVDRIYDISTSLRTFSHSNHSSKSKFDVHEGIESTLRILKYRLKPQNSNGTIEIIRNYSDSPVIECYPGQLNQVFMNIIANAIDALEECEQREAMTIWITTERHGYQSFRIYIKDNGIGISNDIQINIFEQFFTTKIIGKGTGLGLSISRHIIEEKHQGKLNCVSKLGQGTEFTIEIPINSENE